MVEEAGRESEERKRGEEKRSGRGEKRKAERREKEEMIGRDGCT